MFHYIEGLVAEISPPLVVLDCGGIGFAMNATANTIANIRMGDKARLYAAEAIGENNFDLYGFYTKSEKRCFDMLVSVSGIGPKAAMSILSYSTPETLALAIMNDDIKALTVAPGIGKKIAQRVVLELKDKMSKENPVQDMGFTPVITASAENSSAGDAIAALSVLGYSSAEISPVLKKIDTTGMNAEEIIKAVLKHMVK